MIKELIGSLPVLVQLIVGITVIFGVVLSAWAVSRWLRNAIRFRMPRPFLGDGSNIEWAEQKRLEIAAGQYVHDVHTQLSDGEWSEHGVGVEHGQHSPNATPSEIRPDSEDNVGKSSKNEGIMTSTRARLAASDFDDDQWVERILGN